MSKAMPLVMIHGLFGSQSFYAPNRRIAAADVHTPHIRVVVERGIPLFMLAGERSAAGWNAPDWAHAAAHAYVIQPEVGHMMMLEKPDEFCGIVGGMVGQIAA